MTRTSEMSKVGSQTASGVVSSVSTPRSDRTWGASSSLSSASRAFNASFSRLVESSVSRRFPRYFANEGDVCGLTIGTLKEVEVCALPLLLHSPRHETKRVFPTLTSGVSLCSVVVRLLLCCVST